MELSLLAAGLCAVSYLARCFTVWCRARREREAVLSQHRAGTTMAGELPGGSRVRMRSASGDEVTIVVGQRPARELRAPHGG